MSDADPLTEELQQLARIDAQAPACAVVRRRLEAAITAELAGRIATPRRRRRWRLPVSGPLVVTLVSASVTAAVIAVAIVALSHHAVAPRAPLAPPATPRTTALPSRPSRRLLLREDRREHFRAPKRLLSAFDVFQHPAHTVTRNGVTLSRPPLTSLPKQILEIASPRRRNHVDIAQIREIRLSSTLHVWAMPGVRSLCTATSLPMPGNHRVLAWATGCEPIAAAIDQGMGNDAGFGHGIALRTGVQPIGTPKRLRVGHRTVSSTFGVYGFVTPDRRRSYR